MLGAVREARAIDRRRRVGRGFAQDVDDPLVCRGERSGFGKRLERLDRRESRRDEMNVRRLVVHDRGDLVCRVPELAQIAAQPVVDERAKFGARILDPRHRVECLEGDTGEARQRDREALFDEDANHAQCRAPQSEGILVAGRNLADAEEAGEDLDLFGKRNGLRDAIFGKPVAGETRPIVLLDRGRDVRRLAVVLRVIAPHEALQLGEFTDHVGDEIGLGEHRRAIGLLWIGADVRRDRRGDHAHAVHPLRLRAELVVIDDGPEPFDAVGEADLAVLVEEEAGVGQARAQHALVALDDRRGILRLDVADDEEAMDESAAGVGQREIFLVLLHRQDQALLRNLEECPIEGSRVDRGPFDQRRHLVEQRVGHQDRGAAGSLGELRDDARAALGEARDDLAFGAQRFLVGVGVADFDSGAAEEAMTVGQAAGFKAKRAHRNDNVAVQREQLVRGPDEFDVIPVAAMPRISHDLWDRKSFSRFVERVLKATHERLTFREATQENVVCLAVGSRVSPVGAVSRFGRRRREVRSTKPRELLAQRFGRLSVGTERHLGGHQLVDDFFVRRDFSDSSDRNGKPSWGRVGRGYGALVKVSTRPQSLRTVPPRTPRR